MKKLGLAVVLAMIATNLNAQCCDNAITTYYAPAPTAVVWETTPYVEMATPMYHYPVTMTETAYMPTTWTWIETPIVENVFDPCSCSWSTYVRPVYYTYMDVMTPATSEPISVTPETETFTNVPVTEIVEPIENLDSEVLDRDVDIDQEPVDLTDDEFEDN